MYCPRCNAINYGNSAYCSNCGSLLRSSETDAPMPVREHVSYGENSVYQQQMQPMFAAPVVRWTAFRIFRSIFYFVIALPITLFGVLGTLIFAGNSSHIATGIALFLGLCVLASSIVVFYRARIFSPRLGVWQFIWSIAGATFSIFALLILEQTFLPEWSHQQFGSMLFGLFVLLYGIVLSLLALL